MIESIVPRGCLIFECQQPGETRADNVFPAHPNGIPVSRNRWLLLYATRGWRCVDDDLSIVYQLREDSPDGGLIKEGMLSRSRNDWDPFGDGTKTVLQHGHPVLFGVPKGARIGGKIRENANVFVAKWRRKSPGNLDPESGTIERDKTMWTRTQAVEWTQFRLNDTEDDIEILQPKRILRQKGYESGDAFCSRPELKWMNQSFVQSVPFNSSCTEWVDVNHFDGGRIAAVKYRYDSRKGIYDWVETGPVSDVTDWDQIEAGIARAGRDWIICSRATRETGGGHRIENATGWFRTADPFTDMPEPVWSSEPATTSPRTLYTCPDGVLRLFAGDPVISPYKLGRNPLYCWDVDPYAFLPSGRRTIFDAVARGILPAETCPTVDMCKLLPHTGGREQWLLWRVRTRNVMHGYKDLEEGAKVASAYGLPPIREEWKKPHGIYCGVIRYTHDLPGMWEYR